MHPPRTVLRKINGQLNYGTLNGIFGPQNCGKTALLKCLSGRNNRGLDAGTMLFVNPDISIHVFFLENTIYNNILVSMTVQEVLDYAFLFRHPFASREQRQSIVKELLINLQLQELANMRMTDCTVEERVKTQVAMGLSSLDKPNMLFMEEPLSHLDNVSVENFVNLMKQMSRVYSMSVNLSIGQMIDSDVLSIFDKLYVLSRGGLCIYEGSVEHMSLFLRESGVIIQSGIQTPIERLIKIASKPTELTVRVASRVFSTRNDILHLAEKYGVLLGVRIQPPVSPISLINIWHLFQRSLVHKYRYYWKSILFEYWALVSAIVLLVFLFDKGIGEPDSCYQPIDNGRLSTNPDRMLTKNVSNDRISYTKKPESILYGRLVLLDGSLSTNSTLDEYLRDKNVITIHGQHLIEQNLKFLFLTTVLMTLSHFLVSVFALNEEIIVACNEHRNGLININSFIVAETVAYMVMPSINTITCSALAYYLQYPNVDYVLPFHQDHWRFWLYFLSQFAGVACAQNLGLVISAISVSNERLANVITFIAAIVLITFAGYLIPVQSYGNTWLRSLAEISFVKQSYQLTLVTWYGLGRCTMANQTRSFVLEQMNLMEEEFDGYERNLLIISIQYTLFLFLFWLIVTNSVSCSFKASHNYQQTDLIDQSEDDTNQMAEWDEEKFQKIL
ncbi:abc transporter g family member 3-like [Dermatophagoides farinae]|uniref:Abc transporter g family member 3-like n=2 Tax=Dermatophagoides farinae TaxID=6954 RepID=A0A9D4SKM0_DERFA|nr:abc transporter g family member 3-like [Dermatophagoides farinae]